MKSNPIKQNSIRLMRWMVNQNQDKNNYLGLYAFAWAVFLLVLAIVSYNAAKWDYKVLYAMSYNAKGDADSAFWFAVSIAAVIQCIVIVASGIIGKIWAFGLLKQKKHLYQFCIFAPLLVAALGYSLYLSWNVDQIAILESKQQMDLLSDSKSKQLEQTGKAVNLSDLEKKFIADSFRIANAYNEQIEQVKSAYQSKVSVAYNAAKKYNAIDASWAKATARNIKTQDIPKMLSERDSRILEIKQEKQSEIMKALSDKQNEARKRSDLDHSSKSQISTALALKENRLNKTIETLSLTLQGQNIAFSVVGCFITLGLMWFYRFAGEESGVVEEVPMSRIGDLDDPDRLEEIIARLESMTSTDGNQRIDPAMIEEIVKMQTHLRVAVQRVESSKTKEARERNQNKVIQLIEDLKKRFGINTIIQDKQVTYE